MGETGLVVKVVLFLRGRWYKVWRIGGGSGGEVGGCDEGNKRRDDCDGG